MDSAVIISFFPIKRKILFKFLYTFMKNLLFVFLLFGTLVVVDSDAALNVKLGHRISVSDGYAYELICDNAVGDVVYNIDGLPAGAILRDGLIVFDSDAKTGNYVLKVNAIDGSGNTAEQVITLSNTQIDAEETILTRVGNQISEAVQVETRATRLGSILSTYSSIDTLTTRTDTNYPDNQFPLENFPTGENPNSFNPGPTTIFTKKATITDNTRNDITIDDVTLRTASERHQNSVKGITNLLKLIDQARANKKQAEADVAFLTEAHSIAVANQQKAQGTIIKVENRVGQIKTAMEGLEDDLAIFKQKVDDLTVKEQQLQREKIDVLDDVNTVERRKVVIVSRLDDVNKDLAIFVKRLGQTQLQCEQYESIVTETSADVKELRQQLNEIISERTVLEEDVRVKKSRVNDLRRQLAAAEKDLVEVETKLVRIKAEAERIPRVITDLEQSISTTENRLNRCQEQAKEIHIEITRIKEDDGADLANQIQIIEEEIIAKRRVLTNVDNRLTKIVVDNKAYKAKLKQGEDDILFLRDQLRVIQEDLRRVYILGNNANTKVVHAKENLEAAILRYKKECKVVSDATLNLEKVRAEEALARLALEEIITKYSDALPYSIVPNGNGVGVGVPAGNNAIGSGLGPYFGSRSIYNFGSRTQFNSFVSEYFGQGISLKYPSLIESLYAVQSSQLRAQPSSLSGITCGVSNEIVASGEIISANSGIFELLSDQGEIYGVNVGDCTNIQSNIAKHYPAVGNTVVIRGNTISARDIEALDILCLS